MTKAEMMIPNATFKVRNDLNDANAPVSLQTTLWDWQLSWHHPLNPRRSLQAFPKLVESQRHGHLERKHIFVRVWSDTGQSVRYVRTLSLLRQDMLGILEIHRLVSNLRNANIHQMSHTAHTYSPFFPLFFRHCGESYFATMSFFDQSSDMSGDKDDDLDRCLASIVVR